MTTARLVVRIVLYLIAAPLFFITLCVQLVWVQAVFVTLVPFYCIAAAQRPELDEKHVNTVVWVSLLPLSGCRWLLHSIRIL